MAKKISCPYCDAALTKGQYPEHLEAIHAEKYHQFIEEIKRSLDQETDIKNLAERFNVTQRFLSKLIQKLKNQETLYEDPANYTVRKKRFKLEPDNFSPEITTIWGFPDRGQWATHNPKYRGNWSPYIPRNIILRYSQEGDTILDQFVGSGTTLIEAKLLNRKAIGLDINPQAIELAKVNLNFDVSYPEQIKLLTADARNLSFIPDESIDLICTHPPYSNIIKYSDDIPGDLSHLDIEPFIKQMQTVAIECNRVLKKGKFCAILMGDTRRKGHIIPLGFRIMETFISSGLKLKEIIIKEQHNCSSTGYWRNQSLKYNFLLIAHEYLFVFRKI